MPFAGKPGSIDKFAIGKAECCAAHITCKERDIDHGNCIKRIHQSRSERCNDCKSQQDIGEGHQHIDAAHHKVVGAPACIACDDADSRADHGGNQRGCKANRDRDACAPEKAAQNIASKLVCAQQMTCGEDGLQPVCGCCRIRVG